MAELGLRLIGWPQVPDKYTHNAPYWITEPNLTKSAMPHREEETSFLVSTNSDGLRTKHTVKNIKQTFRVMTLGCSTTFGWGVADQETYPARLEWYFHQDGLDVEVINGGQPGYTSFQGLWLWDQALKNYKPDLVLIGYVIQDARKAACSDKSQAVLQADHRFLKDNCLYRSKIYLALGSVLGKIQTKAKEIKGKDQGGVYRVPLEDYAENLRNLVEKINKHNGDVVLFGYPLERSGYTAEHRKALQSVADELKVGHFDPQEKMELAAEQEQLYFARDRGHPNARGNDQVAQWVYSFLREYRTDW